MLNDKKNNVKIQLMTVASLNQYIHTRQMGKVYFKVKDGQRRFWSFSEIKVNHKEQFHAQLVVIMITFCL